MKIKQSHNNKIKNATPVHYNGIKFRSKLEGAVAKALDVKNISYKYEPFKMELLAPFKYNDKPIRGWYYTPDFILEGIGSNPIILEVKGYPNDVWPVKKKMILKYLSTNMTNYHFYEIKNLTHLSNLLNKLCNETKTSDT